MDADTQPAPPGALPTAAALPDGHAIGVFEVQSVWQRSAHAVVYRAWDHALVRPVALKEYLPAAWALRDANGTVRAAPGSAAAFERGLHGFADEARMLARCDHPSLVRVLDLLDVGGTAYRVMPWYDSLTLLELRRQMAGPFGEPALRKLIGQLLGALAAYQRVGGVHRGVNPAQVLLLDEYKAMLLGPGAASRAPSAPLADTLNAPLEPSYAPPEQTLPNGQPQGPWTDFYALAQLARFCITGLPPPPVAAAAEPLAATVQRLFPNQPAVRYSAELLQALDAALSPDVTRRPQTAAQWRTMLGSASAEEAELAPVHSLRNVDAGTQALIRSVIDSIDSIDEPGPAPLHQPKRGPVDVPRLERLAEPIEPIEPTPLAARGEALPPAEFGEPPPLHADPTDRNGPEAQHTAGHRHRAVWVSVAVAVVVAAGLGAWALQSRQPTGRAAADTPPAAVVDAPVTQAPATQAPLTQAPVLQAPASAAKAPASTAALPRQAAPVTAAVPAAPKPPAAKAPVNPPTRTAAPATTPGAGERSITTSPRQECGTRTEFALYRCMQLQCSEARWRRHPQCVRLADTDSVD